MAVDAVPVLLSLQHVAILRVDSSLDSNNKHRCSTRKMTQLTTCTVTLILSVGSNSLCGGPCQFEIISAPNDDMLEGDFELSSRKDFR